MSERKYVPSFSELIDRLSILQLKETFIPENRKVYAKEIVDIVSDLSSIQDEETYIMSGEDIHAIIVLAQSNLHIWHNESKCRDGSGNGDLRLTHALNGIRNTSKNILETSTSMRPDLKVDCIAAEFSDWTPSLWQK